MLAPVPILPRLLARVHLHTLLEAVQRAEAVLRDPAVLAEATALLGQPVGSAEALDAALEDRQARPEFLSWLLWDHCPGQPAPLGRGLLDTTRGHARAIVQALLDTPPRCWEVAELADANHVWIRALGDRRRLLLREPVLAEAARPGDVWVGRVIEVQGVTLLDAVHLWLPATAAPLLRRRAAAIGALARRDQLAAWLGAGLHAVHRLDRQRKRPSLFVEHHYWQLDHDAWLAALDQLTASGAVAPTANGAVVCQPGALAGVQLAWRAGRLRLTLWTPRHAALLAEWTQTTFPAATRLLHVRTDARWLLAHDVKAPWTQQGLRALAESWLAAQLWQQVAAPHQPAAPIPTAPAWWAQVTRVSRWAGKDWQARVARLASRS